MRKVYSVIAVICIFMLFTAPVAFGQDLDGIWFKVTYTAKGNIEGANEAIGQKQQAKVVNYIQLVYNDVWSTQCPGDFSPFYEIHTWYPDGNVWDYDNGAINKDDEACYATYGCPYQGKTFLDKQFVFYAGSGNVLYYRGEDVQLGNSDAMMTINIKRGKNDEFKSATLTSIGCSGGFRNANGYTWGSCTIKGKTIDSDKLPEGISPEGAGVRFTIVPPCTI